MTKHTLETLKALTVDKISQVYSGKREHCRCGCGGEYKATSFANHKRSNVDDVYVEKKLKRAQRLASKGADVDYGDTYIDIKSGDSTCITLYTDELIPVVEAKSEQQKLEKPAKRQYGLKFELKKLIEKFERAEIAIDKGKAWDSVVRDLWTLKSNGYLTAIEREKLQVIYWSSRCAETNLVTLSLKLLVESIEKDELLQSIGKKRLTKVNVGGLNYTAFAFDKEQCAENVVNFYLENNPEYGVISDVDGKIYVARNDDKGTKD